MTAVDRLGFRLRLKTDDGMKGTRTEPENRSHIRLADDRPGIRVVLSYQMLNLLTCEITL